MINIYLYILCIYKLILLQGLPRPEQFKDFDFSNIDPRNPFAQSDKFKANYYQSYKDFFEKVQKRSKVFKFVFNFSKK